jgi:hypothetical protein
MPSSTKRQGGLRLLGAAALIAITTSSSVYAANCVQPRERDSQIVRALQSRLMIAALSCNARSDYNQFVNHYQKQLSYHGAGLQKYFRTKYGKGHKRALNKFVTRLANGASQESIKDRRGFCAESRAIFAELKSASSRRAPKMLRAVALDTDWRHRPAKVCDEAVAQNTERRR